MTKSQFLSENSILFGTFQTLNFQAKSEKTFETFILLKQKVKFCHSVMYDYYFSYANLLSVINSAANFLVYMLRGRKFRKAFISTYNCHKCTSEAIEV